MAAIADFRLIETSRLNDLQNNAEVKIEKRLFGKKVVDNYWDYLQANSKQLNHFDWSGYIFANLLIFLEEKKGINLLKGQYDTIANNITERRQQATFIFTFEHRQKYLIELSPGRFTLMELIEFNKDFSNDDDPESANAGMEGIRALHENLGLLTDNKTVILLSVA